MNKQIKHPFIKGKPSLKKNVRNNLPKKGVHHAPDGWKAPIPGGKSKGSRNLNDIEESSTSNVKFSSSRFLPRPPKPPRKGKPTPYNNRKLDMNEDKEEIVVDPVDVPPPDIDVYDGSGENHLHIDVMNKGDGFLTTSEILEDEDDPDMLKATMEMLSTSHSNNNVHIAISLLEDVQSYCALDFESLCNVDQPLSVSDTIVSWLFNDAFTPVPCDKKLPDVVEVKDGELIPEKEEQEGDVVEIQPAIVEKEENGIKNLNEKQVEMKKFVPYKPSVSRSLFSKVLIFRNSPFTQFITPIGQGNNLRSGEVIGNNNDDDYSYDDDYYIDDDVNVDDREDDHPHPGGWMVDKWRHKWHHSGPIDNHPHPGDKHFDDKKHLYPPPPHEFITDHEHMRMIAHDYDLPNKDFYEDGALGYGKYGDSCIYNHYDDLSPQCQDAIQAVDTFRHEYWEEEKQISHSHDNGGLIFLFIIIFIFLFIKRFNKRSRYIHEITKKNDDVMEVIYKNPQLKTNVEAAYGQQLPELKSSIPKGPNCCCILCKVIGIFILSMIITVSSIHLTQHIMHGLYQRDEDGNEKPPNTFLILLVLFVIISIKIMIIVLIIRFFRYIYHKCRGTTSDDNTTNNNSITSVVLPRIYTRFNQLRNSLSSNTTANTGTFNYSGLQNNGYTPLSHHDDDNSAEMTTFNNTNTLTNFQNPSNQHISQQNMIHSMPNHMYPSAPMQPPNGNNVVYTGIPVQNPPINHNNYNYNRMI
eukprot:TRINITY_DN57369_c0_g1_i1.p1 TRINITY_DN57369_c0_g1~~TRINITY_DN57369_c0_g1_i1.p1  ORF type:complete len:748 (+),score=9.69 TRINITY_DN57369_c0_g1_i1:84-2327(+)